MMNEVVDEYWLINECIMSDFEVIISYVYLCVPMASVQMTAFTRKSNLKLTGKNLKKTDKIIMFIDNC